MASSRQEDSAKVWVLDTHTKGTGANMVPLERVLSHRSETIPGFVLPERQRPDPAQAEPREPYRFKVVDVMTRQVLAQDVDARQAVETLAGIRSIVDITIYVWNGEGGRWRRLTFGEAKTLWEQRVAT